MNRGPFGTKIFSPERTGSGGSPMGPGVAEANWPTTSASRSTTCSRWSTRPSCSAWLWCTTRSWEITDFGREFARADIDTSKKLFGELIAERAPLIKAILRALRATEDGTLREGFFLDLLRRGFSAEEARRQLDIAIDWGRYGELFEYDAESGELGLGSDPEKIGLCLRARGGGLGCARRAVRHGGHLDRFPSSS